MAEQPVEPVAIDEIHERAISLWIHHREVNPRVSPAPGIYFALTDKTLPSDLPTPKDAIELCNVINQTAGKPSLTEEERQALFARSIMLIRQHKEGLSPIQFFLYLVWLNRGGYLIGFISLFIAGPSLWVAGLIIAVWWCFGAARAAVSMAASGNRPRWEVPVIAGLHLLALAALWVVSILRLL